MNECNCYIEIKYQINVIILNTYIDDKYMKSRRFRNIRITNIIDLIIIEPIFFKNK